ncbi:hypothetical protein C8J57DRAFT_1516917 [Mycena rebaudengoi]|nr:hypothetical protein C8J57DRAFT_1516917 [Mycena rebaudengoi]
MSTISSPGPVALAFLRPPPQKRLPHPVSGKNNTNNSTTNLNSSPTLRSRTNSLFDSLAGTPPRSTPSIDDLKPNAHLYPIRTTSTALLTRSNFTSSQQQNGGGTATCRCRPRTSRRIASAPAVTPALAVTGMATCGALIGSLLLEHEHDAVLLASSDLTTLPGTLLIIPPLASLIPDFSAPCFVSSLLFLCSFSSFVVCALCYRKAEYTYLVACVLSLRIGVMTIDALRFMSTWRTQTHVVRLEGGNAPPPAGPVPVDRVKAAGALRRRTPPTSPLRALPARLVHR